MHALFCPGGFIDVRNSLGLSIFTNHDLARHCPGNERKLPSFLGWWNHHLARTKVRRADAATATLAAVVTRWTPIQRLSDDCHPRRNAGYINFVAGFLDDEVRAAWFGRRHENAIGCTGDIFLGAKNADERFDFVVVRRKFFVGDRPVIPSSICRLRLEIYWSESQCDPSPVIGASPNNTRTKPAEARTFRRSVRFASNLPKTVRREEFTEILVASTYASATVWQIKWQKMFFVIMRRIDWRPSFQHNHIQTTLGKDFGRCPSRST